METFLTFTLMMSNHKLSPNSLKLVKSLPFISTGFPFTLVRHMKAYKKLMCFFFEMDGKVPFFCEFIALYNKGKPN